MLADWIVDLAQHGGYLAQTTSVPGVAQRTGATIYYVELFPKAAAQAAGREPVLALMPVPGDVDVVLASELMEAARAVERGFVTPDRTLLIASTHRVFAMTEKIALADGRADVDGAARGLPRRGAPARGLRHGGARGGDRQRVERGAVRRARGLGRAALPAHGVRGGDPPRRGRRQQQPCRVRRRLRGGARRRGAVAAAAAPDQRQDNAPAPICATCCAERRARLFGRGTRRSSPPASSGSTTTRTSDYAEDFLRALERFREHRAASTATAPAGCWRKRRASSRSPWPTRTPSAWRS